MHHHAYENNLYMCMYTCILLSKTDHSRCILWIFGWFPALDQFITEIIRILEHLILDNDI